jgi:prepilin-type processing-associated H-X9-DG protein
VNYEIQTKKGGFTLTEFLVLFGVGSLLLGILAADLTQTRTKLLQQACAANLKHWGMAIDLYTQDYSGTYYGYNSIAVGWSDITSPYGRYLSVSNSAAGMRNMRVCPFIASRYSQDQIVNGSAGFSYTMTDPQAKFGGAPIYRTATGSSAPSTSPYVVTDSVGRRIDLPTLRTVPNLSTFLLVMDGGNSLHCGGLYARATSLPSSPTIGPPIRPCDRHGGGVNCLFGDFHVELVSTQTLAAVDATGGCTGSATGNPWFNMN